MSIKKGSKIRIKAEKEKNEYTVLNVDEATQKVWYYDEMNRGKNHAQIEEVEVVDDSDRNDELDNINRSHRNSAHKSGSSKKSSGNAGQTAKDGVGDSGSTPRAKARTGQIEGDDVVG